MIKDNLKRIMALLLVITMIMSSNTSVFAADIVIQNENEPTEEPAIEEESGDKAEEPVASSTPELDKKPVTGEETPDKIEEPAASGTLEPVEEPAIEMASADKVEEAGLDITPKPAQKPALMAINASRSKARMLANAPESDEAAREKECISNYKNGTSNPEYLKKFLTYLSLKYPEIGIDPQYGTGGNDSITGDSELHNWYNATKMARQTKYNTIEIDGNDEGYTDLTKNMVQFRYLSNFDGSTGGTSGDNHTVKTLIIRNVDEIRNLYVPEFVETLIIENTTINCYETPGFQCGSYGDLKNCRNLKKLVLKNVKFGDNYKHPESEVTEFDSYPYEKNYRLNLEKCTNLEELYIDVSFDGAPEVQLAIDGGADNKFEKLTDDKCNINPAPGTGYGQVMLYAKEDSYLAKRYNSSESVKFKNGQFRIWLLEALGIDTNHDGVISQAELDAIDTLKINDQTARSISQSSLSGFQELADIGQMHDLKNLEIDFYDPSHSMNENRQTLKGIDFPDSLENLSIKNVYWEKDTQTKSHDNADIVLTNLKTLELYNTDVKVDTGDSYFNHHTQIKLTDTKGVLRSCIIEKTDVESIELTNNSNGKGIKDQDEKQRIRFSASDCQNLKSVEFLGEGYAVEGSLDLTNDTALTHIGVPNEGKWTVYGEFDSTYAPINVILNSCTKLGSECSEIVIDYDFINGRDINVQALDTNFSNDHKLSIYRNPRLHEDTAGKVYLSCDSTGSNRWIYNKYKDESGFVIENRSSFPTIAVFSNGQRIKTSGDGNHNNDSGFTEDSDRWVDRWDLVMSPKGYSNDFGNLTFYVVDKTDDGAGNRSESLRKVFYKENVYVEWEQQENTDPIIVLPTEKVPEGYKLTGTKLSSTGIPGEVELKLYVYNAEGGKSYIGYQNIKVFKMPDSIELVNDGTELGSGTKDDPYVIYKNEELKLKARPKVNGDVDRSGDYALRDVYWRIKEYDETPKYTSDSDGYSLYTLDSATKAGISVVRGNLNPGETEEQYDRRTDNEGVGGSEPTYYNHRRFSFNTAGTKFKIVAQSPYKFNSDGSDRVISSEIFVVFNNFDKPSGENPSGDNPGGDDPGSVTPGGDDPGSVTPGGDDPGSVTPGEDGPGSVTPGEDNPGSETPGEDGPGSVTPSGDNPGGGNHSEESSSEENSSAENSLPSTIPVYTVPVGTASAGTIPVYNTIPVDPVRNPGIQTLGVPVVDAKNPGLYVMPDPAKNEVVYMAPPADYTKKTIKIPDKIVINGKEMLVVKIDPGAFKNNVNVKTIKIGKNIRVIGSGAFEGATNLKNITLGKNVEVIGDGAFKDCVSLTSITLPSKATQIGFAVFGGCMKLKTIKITSKKLTSLSVAFGAFNGLTEKTTVRVPRSMLKAYKMLFAEKLINPMVKIKRY